MSVNVISKESILFVGYQIKLVAEKAFVVLTCVEVKVRIRHSVAMRTEHVLTIMCQSHVCPCHLWKDFTQNRCCWLPSRATVRA